MQANATPRVYHETYEQVTSCTKLGTKPTSINCPDANADDWLCAQLWQAEWTSGTQTWIQARADGMDAMIFIDIWEVNADIGIREQESFYTSRTFASTGSVIGATIRPCNIFTIRWSVHCRVRCARNCEQHHLNTAAAAATSALVTCSIGTLFRLNM
jgi:hypothetical protein